MEKYFLSVQLLTGIIILLILGLAFFLIHSFKKRNKIKTGNGFTDFYHIQVRPVTENKTGTVEMKLPVMIETIDNKIAAQPISAQTTVINFSGAFLACSEPLPIGEKFNMTIELTDGTRLSLLAETTWNNKNVPESSVLIRGMRIRFINISKQDRQYLMKEINTLN